MLPNPTESRRDLVIDGFRGVAVMCVIAGHAMAYRFANTEWGVFRFLPRLSGPLAELGVRTFFIISGFIITSLLLREEKIRSRINIPAFYIRRAFRILPAFLAYLIVVEIVRRMGLIALPGNQILLAGTFLCNTNISCDWWVAHTWSLAVEEQYYIVWPFLFWVLPRSLRPIFLAIMTVLLLSVFLLSPFVWHSNALSYACIAAGGCFATVPTLQVALKRLSHPIVWLCTTLLMLIGPLTKASALVDGMFPILGIYFIFAAREIAWVAAILRSKPLQLAGVGSYSLYLWQQLFLANPANYLAGNAPWVWVLIPVVIGSVILVEKPSIKLGHRFSARLADRTPIDASA